MSNLIYSIHCEDAAGFQITLDALVEDLPLAYTFDDSVDDLQQMARDIDSGKYLYFCARVRAYKVGVVLGEDYRGACLYDSLEQFRDSSDYFADMVESCVEHARDKLRELATN